MYGIIAFVKDLLYALWTFRMQLIGLVVGVYLIYGALFDQEQICAFTYMRPYNWLALIEKKTGQKPYRLCAGIVGSIIFLGAGASVITSL